MAVLASGLSIMILRLPGIGVGAVVGSVDPDGVAEALAEAEALADADAPAGDPLSSTKVVVLSPPHPASAADASPATRTTPNPFITLSNDSAPQGLRGNPSRSVYRAERIIVRARDR
jgi:hypothetical protein